MRKLKEILFAGAALGLATATPTSAQTVSRYEDCISAIANQCGQQYEQAADLRACTDQRAADCDGIREEEGGPHNPLSDHPNDLNFCSAISRFGVFCVA